MKGAKKTIVALLACAVIGGAAFGGVGCGNKEQDYEIGANDWSLQTAYMKAHSLGYEGSLAEFLDSIRGKDGVGIADVSFNDDGELVILFTNGTMKNLGAIASEEAETPAYNETFAYIISEDGSYYSVRGMGFYEDYEVVIPSTYRGLPVKKILSGAFLGEEGITSVTIPDTVTYVGDYAFYGCKNLATINVSDSLVSVGIDAFDDTAYYKNWNNWEESMLYIGKCLVGTSKFLQEGISVKIGTLGVARRVFEDCIYTDITLPASLVFLGEEAFYGCKKLESVIYLGTTKEFGKVVEKYWEVGASFTSVVCADGKIEIERDWTGNY